MLSIALAGCANVSTTSAPKTTWVRMDGKRGAGDTALLQQFEKDRISCRGELQKAAAQSRTEASDEVDPNCMVSKGYVLVREDEAEAKRREFAAAAAEKTRRGAATGTTTDNR